MINHFRNKKNFFLLGLLVSIFVVLIIAQFPLSSIKTGDFLRKFLLTLKELFFNVTKVSMNYGEQIFFVSSICFIFELIRPVKQYSKVSRIRGVFFLIVYILITTILLTLLHQVWSKFGFQPMFVINFGLLSTSPIFLLKICGGIVAFILTSAISEFFYYWFHRLQHANAFLWRFHSIHHSLRELSVWNSYHHFTEELFRIPFFILPSSFFLQGDAGYVPILFYIIIIMQGPFAHSSTKFNFGIFRYFIIDNKYHRIHHSIEPQHYNKNFGAFTTIWDIVFKTANFPHHNDWPDAGLTYIDEPKKLADFLWRPFR